MPDKQPYNILLITSDQQRWDTLGRQNPAIQTPNLDRLAARGITYNRAYTCNPVCTPTRCSILTGHYPSRHGCYTIGTSLPQDYPTVPAELARRGQFTSLIGKGHFQSCIHPESFEGPVNIHDRDYFRGWTGPYYGFEHVQLVIGHSCEQHAAGMHYGVWLDDHGVDTGAYFGTRPYTAYGTWELPEQYHNSTWTADQTIAAIDQAGERPFTIWSSFQDPHNPCVVPEPWASMYDPADMPVYPPHPDEMADKPPLYARRMSSGKFMDDADLSGKNWHCVRTSAEHDLEDEQERRRIMAMYYGMVSLMDHHIGRILDHLEASGQLDRTIVIFTSDHGDYMGNHELWWKGLPAYEDIQRVPFIVAHPDCATPGAQSEALQSLVDLGRTFIANAGGHTPPLLQGVDQLPAWRDATVAVRDWAMVEFRPSEAAFMQKTLIHGDHKLVVYNDPAYGELYDLRQDPDQLRNLWSVDAAASVKATMLGCFIRAEMEKDGSLRTRLAPA